MIRAMLTTRHPLLAKQITAGHIDIANDQTGSAARSHHDIEVYRRAGDKPEPELLRTGRLENFDRGELSYYDLLHQALNAVAADGFDETLRIQPRLEVTVTQIPGDAGKPKLEGVIRIERQKGGTDTAARFQVDLLASDDVDGQLKVYRTGRLRDFDTTQAGCLELLRAGLNATVKDGFYRRSRTAGGVDQSNR